MMSHLLGRSLVGGADYSCRQWKVYGPAGGKFPSGLYPRRKSCKLSVTDANCSE